MAVWTKESEVCAKMTRANIPNLSLSKLGSKLLITWHLGHALNTKWPEGKIKTKEKTNQKICIGQDYLAASKY